MLFWISSRQSIAQKISKTYKNITVIAFDGLLMYSPTGEITGISKEWPVDGRGDNKDEQEYIKEEKKFKDLEQQNLKKYNS